MLMMPMGEHDVVQWVGVGMDRVLKGVCWGLHAV
jgi:hypothetical protein